MPFLFKLIGTVAACGIVFVTGYLGRNAVMAEAPSNNDVIWKHYLRLNGDRLGYQFTFEEIHRPGERSPGQGVLIRDDERITSIEQLIAKLSKAIKGLSFIVDKKHPRVVHIIDDELLKMEGYVLDKPINIQFKGTPRGLVEDLEAKMPNISARRSGTNTEAFDDDLTQISADDRDKPLRDVLTDIVPLKEYGPFLWIAETSFVEDRPVTIIQHYGPRRQPAFSR